MNKPTLCILSLLSCASALVAQRASDSLVFSNKAKIAIDYQPVSLGGGATFAALLADDEQGKQMRDFFNDQGFKRRVDGHLELGADGEIGGQTLDAGTYKLSFRIDADRVWHLVVLSDSDEEICTVALTATEEEGHSAPALVGRVIADDNAKANGRLEFRFGSTVAHTSFRCGDAAAGKGGGNANDDSPHASHSIELAGGKISVTYRQLSVGSGSNLRGLLAKDDRGAQFRAFYNEQYLPNYVDGKLTVGGATKVGNVALEAGEYGFTFRIDDELQWHLVLSKGEQKVGEVALPANKADSNASPRLVVQPVGDKLAVRYGPLSADVPLQPTSAKAAVPAAADK